MPIRSLGLIPEATLRQASVPTYSGERKPTGLNAPRLTALAAARQIESMNKTCPINSIRNVCVYCGSGSGSDPHFIEAAEALGRSLAEAGIGLVYGGGGEGLMGRVARATLDSGGRVTGIIPSFLIRKEHPLTDAQELLIVDTMHERKQAMFDRADAFVALPGGVGTLEELVEQMTWAALDRHAKPILIADVDGFWRPLLALFAHMNNKGFIRRGLELRYLVAEKIEDIVPMLRTAAERNAERAATAPPVSHKM